ncbi:hypothetical protein [Pseudomonas sp. KU43P]|uniref:hypothetical protein n=1 Tax=Pseudomonas sp. KU43P TaxID=2487887 RepID=UPI00295429AD|nr:hypothetical protein [Pseudomonas sp. KU43P]
MTETSDLQALIQRYKVETSQTHIVSIPKFLIMINLSVGAYLFYWYYRQWLLSRGQRGFKLIPLLCCLAGPLLIYPLLKKIMRQCEVRTQGLKCSPWKVTLMFWLPYAFTIAWHFSVPETPSSHLPLSITMLVQTILLAVCWSLPTVALIHVQQVANAGAGDTLGQHNAQITWANGLWIIASWMPIAALMGYVARFL